MTLTVLACALLFGAAAPFAAADGREERGAGLYADQAAYLAGQLRQNPVYLSDQVPRAVPRSAAPRFAEIAERTGVPTYVALLPGRSIGTDGDALLDAVQARMDEKGLYVLLDETQVDAARAYGVDVPAREALATVLYETPEDAGTEYFFDSFVTVLTSGEAARQKERAEAAHGPGRPRPEQMYLDRGDRLDNIAFAGAAITGIPLAVFLSTMLVLNRRAERRDRAAAAAHGATRRTKSGKGSTPVPKFRDKAAKRRQQVVGYVCLGIAVPLAAGSVYMFSGGSWKPETTPTYEDMQARVVRVAEGLRKDPVYSDPESRSTLSEADRERLRSRIEALDVPMYVTEVPVLAHSASDGELQFFAEDLSEQTAEAGVYVFADPAGGDIAVTNCGAQLSDALYWDVPLDVEEPFGADRTAPGLAMADRLNRLVTHVEELPEDELGSECYALDVTPELEDRALPSLLGSGVFWTWLLAWGPLLAVLVAALVNGGLKLLDRRNAEA